MAIISPWVCCSQFESYYLTFKEPQKPLLGNAKITRRIHDVIVSHKGLPKEDAVFPVDLFVWLCNYGVYDVVLVR